jgi:predicted metal-dependent enzyme (double-stranded beta helix superfamily)
MLTDNQTGTCVTLHSNGTYEWGKERAQIIDSEDGEDMEDEDREQQTKMKEVEMVPEPEVTIVENTMRDKEIVG